MLRCILNLLYVLYFGTHIPITIFIDMQTIFPNKYFPKQAVEMMTWYRRTFRDSYVQDPPPWYATFGYTEIFLQLPFFFYAFYTFLIGKNYQKIRIPLIMYSCHVMTAVAAILAQFAFHHFKDVRHPGPINDSERTRICAIYAPYFVIPLIMLIDALTCSSYRSTCQKCSTMKKTE